MIISYYTCIIIYYSLRFLKIFLVTVPTDTKEDPLVWGGKSRREKGVKINKQIKRVKVGERKGVKLN